MKHFVLPSDDNTQDIAKQSIRGYLDNHNIRDIEFIPETVDFPLGGGAVGQNPTGAIEITMKLVPK